ncbi:hypothetical protein BC831DRAFT_510956 [Entophlyctis helioformis]|nr:hypothetical protein BC831DRAFT_510956 [Entophlyctis helioformis]
MAGASARGRLSVCRTLEEAAAARASLEAETALQASEPAAPVTLSASEQLTPSFRAETFNVSEGFTAQAAIKGTEYKRPLSYGRSMYYLPRAQGRLGGRDSSASVGRDSGANGGRGSGASGTTHRKQLSEQDKREILSVLEKTPEEQLPGVMKRLAEKYQRSLLTIKNIHTKGASCIVRKPTVRAPSFENMLIDAVDDLRNAGETVTERKLLELAIAIKDKLLDESSGNHILSPKERNVLKKLKLGNGWLYGFKERCSNRASAPAEDRAPLEPIEPKVVTLENGIKLRTKGHASHQSRQKTGAAMPQAANEDDQESVPTPPSVEEALHGMDVAIRAMESLGKYESVERLKKERLEMESWLDVTPTPSSSSSRRSSTRLRQLYTPVSNSFKSKAAGV